MQSERKASHTANGGKTAPAAAAEKPRHAPPDAGACDATRLTSGRRASYTIYERRQDL